MQLPIVLNNHMTKTPSCMNIQQLRCKNHLESSTAPSELLSKSLLAIIKRRKTDKAY